MSEQPSDTRSPAPGGIPDPQAFSRRFQEIINENEQKTVVYSPESERRTAPINLPAAAIRPAPLRAAVQPAAPVPAAPVPAAPNAPEPQEKPKRMKKEKKPKKKHTLLKVFLSLFLIVAILAGSVIGGAYFIYSKLTESYQWQELEQNINADTLFSDEKVYNILLMGVDNAEVGKHVRSDSMTLLSIDTKHKTLKLTTFLRDMYVDMPGYGKTKLTHASSYSGPQLTVDTIELNLGIDIDAYVRIGYDIFKTLVNGVGGVTVGEVTEAEIAALANEKVYDLEPGKNVHVNGNQALQLCRIRKGKGLSDYTRAARQREVISLIIQKAKELGPLDLYRLAEKVIPMVETSIPKDELIRLGYRVYQCLDSEIEQQQIPAEGTFTGDMRYDEAERMNLWVEDFDVEKNKKILMDFIYGD